MRIKPVTDHALRMLIYLALKNNVTNSKEISEQLNIPQKNVLSIGRNLKRAKYVSIINGPYGGYILTRKPENILLYKMINIFEDIKINCRSGEKKGNQIIVETAANNLYSKLQVVIEEKLKSETLADLISGGMEISL